MSGKSRLGKFSSSHAQGNINDHYKVSSCTVHKLYSSKFNQIYFGIPRSHVTIWYHVWERWRDYAEQSEEWEGQIKTIYRTVAVPYIMKKLTEWTRKNIWKITECARKATQGYTKQTIDQWSDYEVMKYLIINTWSINTTITGCYIIVTWDSLWDCGLSCFNCGISVEQSTWKACGSEMLQNQQCEAIPPVVSVVKVKAHA